MTTKAYFHGASWCPQCPQAKAMTERICKKRGAEFIYVDIDVTPAMIDNLTSVPAIMVVKDNEEPVVLRSSAVNPRTLEVAL